MDVPSVIELGLQSFTEQVNAAFVDLETFSNDALAWLCREHFVVAQAKPGWFERAATASALFDAPAPLAALLTHRDQDRNLAQRYFAVLEQTQLDPLLRIEFTPTTSLVDRINDLVAGPPSTMLGAAYVLERLHPFEHQIFGRFTKALHDRRVLRGRGLTLLDFHLHGQHKASTSNELGAFLLAVPSDAHEWRRTDEDPTLRPLDVIQGALAALEQHLCWWQNLLPVSMEKSVPVRVV